MPKDLNRPLRYAPCIRCDCPLTIFLTDHRHRFVCVRCHANMVAKATRGKNPCWCADIQTCAKCFERENFLRRRRRNLEARAKIMRTYRLLNSEKLKEQAKRHRDKYRAKKRAEKEAAANADSTGEKQGRDS